MFTSLRIRTKLAIALFLPLVALVASSSLVIGAANQRADDASADAEAMAEQVALATAALGPSGILTTLASERTAESLVLIGLELSLLGEDRDQADIRAATDRAVDQFRRSIATAPTAVQETYAPAIANLDRLEDLRAGSDASTDRNLQNPAATDAFDGYTEIITGIFNANTRTADSVDDPVLRAGVRYVDQLTRHQDTSSVLQRAIGGAFTFRGATTLFEDPPSLAQAAALANVASTLRRDLEGNSVPFYADLARDYFSAPSVVGSQQVQDDALSGAPIDIGALTSAAGADAEITFAEALGEGSERLRADAEAIRAAAQDEADTAAAQARLIVVVTGAVLLAAIAVTLLASRSITRPLSRLVHAAEHMATSALPGAVKRILETPLGDDVVVPDLDQIDSSGGEEIAEVAGALNTVQRSAADLAVEQAVLRRNIADAFVNLGRRNQALLTRLLTSITDMEHHESDPDQLQKLFGLDHLATRMRRNAESLVVLAGVDTRRQWSSPVPVIDVVRGALGEVEDYERAEIVELDDAHVNGGAVAELTHLVAELLENALNHSPPTKPVEIRGRAHADGYALVIVDHGVGMPAEDLAVANTRLSGGESFTVAPSRYLGHYVVGRQASRLGLSVWLTDTPTGGTTATIEFGAVIAPVPTAEPDAAPPAAAPAAADPDRPVTPVAKGSAPVPATEAAPDPAAARPSAPAPGEGSADDEAERAERSRRAAELAEVLGRTATGPVTAEAEVDRSGDTPAEEAEHDTTRSGYKRRVRGAHAPDTGIRTARPDAAPRRRAADPSSVRSALNSMQAGLQRGLADPDENPDRDPADGPEERP